MACDGPRLAERHTRMPNKHFNLTPRSEAKGSVALKPGPQRIDVDRIRLRRDADTRPLNAKHVLDLAESIAVLGLLEPLVIDREGYLLAGGHRLAALRLLGITDDQKRIQDFLDASADGTGKESKAMAKLAQRVGSLRSQKQAAHALSKGVPVLVMEVQSADRKRTLAIEMAENTVRRSYSAEEIKKLAGRLKAEGYKSTVGRPKAGEVSVLNALEAAVGKSKRQIERIIAGDRGGKSEWDNARSALQRAARAILTTGSRHQSQQAKKLQDLARKALSILEDDGGSD